VPHANAQVAARNLECHIGSAAANALGIGLPFLVAWLFYFGHSFSDLVNLASPFLNGAVQFVVPALLFAAYESYESAATLPGAAAGEAGQRAERVTRVLGLRARASTWRAAAVAIALGVAALIGATYGLSAAVGAGVIRAGALGHQPADYAS
jgi:hypothetical protein